MSAIGELSALRRIRLPVDFWFLMRWISLKTERKRLFLECVRCKRAVNYILSWSHESRKIVCPNAAANAAGKSFIPCCRTAANRKSDLGKAELSRAVNLSSLRTYLSFEVNRFITRP